MASQSNSGPVRIEKIQVSKVRSINIKLWGPANHPQWGMTRSSIEIQEARKNEEGQISYGKALRIPCDGTAAILADYISSYMVEGRNLNSAFRKDQETLPETRTDLDSEEIEVILLENFNNQKLSKTRILQILNAKGVSIDNIKLLDVLESLVESQKINKESAIHSASGNTYTLWHFA